MKFQITEEAKKVWKEVDFVDRYKSMSNKYKSENTLEKSDKEKVLGILKNIGYPNAKYDRKENFFSVEDEKSESIESYINISLKYGVLEIISGVKNKLEDIYIPVSPNIVFRFLGLREELPRKPAFSNYEELEELIKDSFSLYEDIKKEVIKVQP